MSQSANCFQRKVMALMWLSLCTIKECKSGNNLSRVAAAAAKSLHLCPTLCDPIDGSPPGSPVPGILQARTLEWVAIAFSNAWKWKMKVKSLSRVRLLATPWTAAYQSPLSLGFSRQKYWSGVPLTSPCQELPWLNLVFWDDEMQRIQALIFIPHYSHPSNASPPPLSL